MAMSATTIAEAHRAFGTSADVLRRRRALYSATIEVADPDAVAVTDVDVLDSPLVRGHLGEILSGREQFAAAAMTPLSEIGIVPDRGVPDAARIAAGPSASTLDRALQGVAVRIGTGIGPIVRPGTPTFDTAVARIAEGVALLGGLSPELAADVLPHIALIAVVPENRRLGSASFRELPGLVVIPEPRTAFEVVEALVHEGAHQRYFDLGVTSALLAPSAFRGPLFRASWSPAAAAPWPIEQCFAAFHAYRCLAALENARAAAGVEHHQFSLLPDADRRATEIAHWLSRHTTHLGVDGRRLLTLLTAGGAAQDPPSRSPSADPDDADAYRDCGDRVLLAFAESPIRLVWQPSSADDGRSVGPPVRSGAQPAARSRRRSGSPDPDG